MQKPYAAAAYENVHRCDAAPREFKITL